jgi:glycosyltransferase involved in cell wall biosynthesis
MSKKEKFKVLVLSDHALSTSGVGTQTRHLIEGLLQKDTWTFRQFGAAMKHEDYRTVVVNEDFIIKPIDGFGNPDLLRVTLATEKPDVLFIFTDPRFFTWLFEMEDEIHQICPIVWWHVWDNYPFPEFNRFYYDATDLLNCHSHLTYTMLNSRYPDKTNFIPHSLPENLFYPLPENEIKKYKNDILGPEQKENFVGIWVNRNAKRKRPNDVLLAFSKFLEMLKKREGHKKATLIMHTEPSDSEGPNLYAAAEMLGIQDNVMFSRDRLDFEKMNILYNISDYCVNISFAEGFGLATLESMMAGVPIIAAKTGGLTRQVVDHNDKTENGVAINIKTQSLVGSQSVPYIYEDYVDNYDVAKGMFKLYKNNKNVKKRSELKRKVYKYATKEFAYQKTIDLWHETMLKTLKEFKENKKSSWTIKTF